MTRSVEAKDWARIITFESKMPSLASAMARRMWFVVLGRIGAWQLSTTVSPSISVSIVPPPSSRSLFR